MGDLVDGDNNTGEGNLNNASAPRSNRDVHCRRIDHERAVGFLGTYGNEEHDPVIDL